MWFHVFVLAYRCSSQLPPLLLQPELPHTEPKQASTATPPQQPWPHYQGECQLCYITSVIWYFRQLSGHTSTVVQYWGKYVIYHSHQGLAMFSGPWNHKSLNVDPLSHSSLVIHIIALTPCQKHILTWYIFFALMISDLVYYSVCHTEHQ